MKLFIVYLAILSVFSSLRCMQPEDRRVTDQAQDNPLWRAATPQPPARHPSPSSMMLRAPLRRTESSSPNRMVTPSRLRDALHASLSSGDIHQEQIVVKEPTIKKEITRSDSPRVAVLKLRSSKNKFSPRTQEELAAIFDVPCNEKVAIESIDLDALGLELITAIKQNTRKGKGIIFDGVEKKAKEKIEKISCAEKIIEAKKQKIAESKRRLRRTNTIG